MRTQTMASAHERSSRLVAMLFAGLLAAAMALVLPAPHANAARSASDGRAALVKELNDLRVSHGLKPLTVSPGLQAVAQRWSKKMSNAAALSHNPNVGPSIPQGWRSWGENVGMARGYVDNAMKIQEGWVLSSGHFRNMIATKFTHIGIGYVETSKGAYATQVFATYPSSASPRVTKLSFKKIRAGKTTKIAIRGRSLQNVTRVRIGKRTAKIVSKSKTRLVVKITKPKTGRTHVRVRNPLGWSAATSATRIVVQR